MVGAAVTFHCSFHNTIEQLLFLVGLPVASRFVLSYERGRRMTLHISSVRTVQFDLPCKDPPNLRICSLLFVESCFSIQIVHSLSSIISEKSR